MGIEDRETCGNSCTESSHALRESTSTMRTRSSGVVVPERSSGGFVDDPACLSGWLVKIAPYFHAPGTRAEYAYDFRDGWEHEVRLVSIAAREPRTKYPRCVAGERACPPEDCGGPGGYAQLLKVLKNPRHKEHREMLEWIGRPFDASAFDPCGVHFDNPKKRWRIAFGGGEG
jgi:hypothetical protein